jgi:hypothetical protein
MPPIGVSLRGVHLTDVYLIGIVYLTGVHLTGMHLIGGISYITDIPYNFRRSFPGKILFEDLVPKLSGGLIPKR